MDLKPGDFFIGIIDFFSVLLPGALITFFIDAHWRDEIFGPGNIVPYEPDNLSRGLIFLFCSYVLGHFIFALGSQLDPLYNRLLRGWFTKNYDLAFCAANLAMDKYVRARELKQEIVNSGKFARRFADENGNLGIY